MKQLIVVCGEAATGKTSWARLVARSLRAALLDLDTVSAPLVQAAQRELARDPFDRDSPEYKRAFREPIHETLFAVARDAECDVVLVAPFTRERRSVDFPDFLNGRVPSDRLSIHYFVASGPRRRSLFEARREPRDLPKLDGRVSYAIPPAPESPPPYPHVFFDTTTKFPGTADLANIFGTSGANLGA